MFFQTLKSYKLTYQRAATLLHISVDTIKKWKLEPTTTPKWANILIERKMRSFIGFPDIFNPTDFMKQMRNSHNLKHQEIAICIGVTPPLISKWLYQKTTPAWAVESLMLAILNNEIANI